MIIILQLSYYFDGKCLLYAWCSYFHVRHMLTMSTLHFNIVLFFTLIGVILFDTVGWQMGRACKNRVLVFW